MMHRLFLPFCVSLLTYGSLSAALPPLYQGLKEFNAVLNDPDLVKELSAGEVLEGIRKTHTGYEVTTNHSTIQVDIEYLPAQHPGPVQFLLHFHPIHSL